jgi:hypothetical protein
MEAIPHMRFTVSHSVSLRSISYIHPFICVLSLGFPFLLAFLIYGQQTYLMVEEDFSLEEPSS